jgi:hypothetical protein
MSSLKTEKQRDRNFKFEDQGQNTVRKSGKKSYFLR